MCNDCKHQLDDHRCLPGHVGMCQIQDCKCKGPGRNAR